MTLIHRLHRITEVLLEAYMGFWNFISQPIKSYFGDGFSTVLDWITSFLDGYPLIGSKLSEFVTYSFNTPFVEVILGYVLVFAVWQFVTWILNIFT